MKTILEALNKPADAYRHPHQGVSYLLVGLTILLVPLLQLIFHAFTDAGRILQPLHVLFIFFCGIVSYLLVTLLFFIVCKGFGSKTPLPTYVKTWGISFFPNMLCSIIVTITETFFYIFWNSTLWGMILGITFFAILIWKIILYLLFLYEVAGLKGIRLIGAFVIMTLLIACLTPVNSYVGLIVPIL